MEQLHTLAAIVEKLRIKPVSLRLFGIESKDFDRYVQVEAVPHQKAYCTMPTLVEADGNAVHYHTVEDKSTMLSEDSSQATESSLSATYVNKTSNTLQDLLAEKSKEPPSTSNLSDFSILPNSDASADDILYSGCNDPTELLNSEPFYNVDVT